MAAVIKSDICIISEGSYPYIRGGVADWIEKLIVNMPEKKFSLVFLGSEEKAYHKKKYDFPENLIEYKEIYLFENKTCKKTKINRNIFEDLSEIIYNLGNTSYSRKIKLFYSKLIKKGIDSGALIKDEGFYDFIVTFAKKYAHNNSFTDFYWNINFMSVPIINLINCIDNIPEARIYHSVSTGYAGLLGSLVKIIKGKNFILTEHGIYTRERKIDINQTDWIYQEKINSLFHIDTALFFKRLWVNFFSVLSKITYDQADRIFSITSGNLNTQKEEGADLKKLSLVPNGIDISRFSDCLKNRENIKKIALVGRVVPVKDILSYLKLCHLIHMEKPDITFEINGPYDEDKEYYLMCNNYVKMIGMEKYIKFTGRVDLSEKFKEIDLLVLTSISEGLPLVVLEGFSAGIPAVCTDVGGCIDLVYGVFSNKDDIDLGKAGEISPPMDIKGMSEKILDLINTPSIYKDCCETALKRVNKFYSIDVFIDSYRRYYNKWLV